MLGKPGNPACRLIDRLLILELQENFSAPERPSGVKKKPVLKSPLLFAAFVVNTSGSHESISVTSDGGDVHLCCWWL